MKIGILTHYNVYNMGAQLQLSAMRYYLEDLGHQVIVLTMKRILISWKAKKRKTARL